jgi:hypothetical protein
MLTITSSPIATPRTTTHPIDNHKPTTPPDHTMAITQEDLSITAANTTQTLTDPKTKITNPEFNTLQEIKNKREAFVQLQVEE